MTEPTQAQVEAALSEFYGNAESKLEDRMSAALTAAAEVSTLAPGCCSAIVPCQHQREHPDSICEQCTAAAEVGSDPFAASKTSADFDLGWNEAIERCAKVADKWNLKDGDGPEIAAAIRALKEKP